MVEVRRLTGPALAEAIPAVAALRIDVFKSFPYLYDGDLAYEAAYLAPFATSSDSVLIAAFDGDTIVGASTGTPLLSHGDAFAAAFAQTDLDLSKVFYCAESVLLPQYRGQGIGHAFFDHRETGARALGCTYSAFCAVVRPQDHPARPETYRSHDVFWRGRGYAPLPGIVAHFSWKDLGDASETSKPLQFWGRTL